MRACNIVDCAIAIVFVLILSFYIVPEGISLFLDNENKISNTIKEKILLAGKTYLENNKNENKVSLKELYSKGYLTYNDFNYKECFSSISTVNKDKTTYKLNLKCVDDNSTLTLLQ